MKFEELKQAFSFAKDAENKLKMPLPKEIKEQLSKQKSEYEKTLQKYNKLFVVDMKDLLLTLETYFEHKNNKIPHIKLTFQKHEQTVECFEAPDYTRTFYTYFLNLDLISKKYSINISLYPQNGRHLSELDILCMDCKTNMASVLNAFYTDSTLLDLYANYDDILDELWKVVAQNVQKLNKANIDKINKEQSLIRKKIDDLQNPEVIQKKVDKLNGDIASLEREKNKYAPNQIDALL